jgi:hypothetical protein
MTTHDLKTWPNGFEALIQGVKPFELRRGDRGFKAGDILMLREYFPETQTYSGRYLRARVLYVTEYGEFPGLMPGFVIMGIGSVDGRWGVEMTATAEVTHHGAEVSATAEVIKGG